MPKNLRKWGLLTLAFGWPLLLVEVFPQNDFLGIAVVALLNGLILGAWAFS